MNKFLFSFGSKQVIVEAEDLYGAKKKGVQELNVPLSKLWQVDVRLIKDGEVEVDSTEL